MKKLIASVISFVFVASPLSLFAAPLENINQVASRATQIGNLVIQLAIALAVVWIVVSVVRFFIVGAADEEARKKGRDSIMYGVIGLAVILSIWGLVFILTQSFSTRNATPTQEINKIGTLPPLPTVDTGNGGSSSTFYDSSRTGYPDYGDVPADGTQTYYDSFGNPHQIRQ